MLLEQTRAWEEQLKAQKAEQEAEQLAEQSSGGSEGPPPPSPHRAPSAGSSAGAGGRLVRRASDSAIQKRSLMCAPLRSNRNPPDTHLTPTGLPQLSSDAHLQVRAAALGPRLGRGGREWWDAADGRRARRPAGGRGRAGGGRDGDLPGGLAQPHRTLYTLQSEYSPTVHRTPGTHYAMATYQVA